MAILSGRMNLWICPAWGPLRCIAPRLPLLLLPALVAAFAAVTALSETPPPIRARWIWSQGGDVHAYNQTVVARKLVDLPPLRQATLRITADSFYRVSINGVWVNDGPARAWPEHYQYDVLDATPFLTEGSNEIRVIARHYGVGDFHRIPQQAGLLAQLDMVDRDGAESTVITDGSWEIAPASAWISSTPKVSIQMAPMEIYDARLEDNLEFAKAAVLFDADRGPWENLAPRETRLLTKQPFALKAFLDARIVKADGWNYLMPAARLVNPGVIEANHTVSQACGMAALIEAQETVTLQIESEGMAVAVDGRRNDKNAFSLAPGRHLVLAFVREVCDHEKHKGVRFMNPRGFRLENPMQSGSSNPWVFLRFPEFAFATNDLNWIGFRHEDARVSAIIDRYRNETEQLLGEVADPESFRDRLGRRAESMQQDAMFVQDPTWQFQRRQVVGDARPLVAEPAGLMYDHAEVTVVEPSADGDVELLYDLGEQSCGYYCFDLRAEAGVVVDIFGVEYIAPDGRIQHSWGNRNGLRYITKTGVNRFTSLKRRSGRYLFVTLRNQKAPVTFRNLSLIESTYPVHYGGTFACSDSRLNEIWTISTRTLKLCMEDTFTDCPLYEQTHWVGDARNESLFAYGVFGATDLARRCINITAQSLDRYPIAGCQTPSGWDVLLPAWSFLWGLSTWDYYWHTGDLEFLRGIYPAVIRNLQGAETFVNDRNLFSAPFWNFFDWVNIDQSPKTVLHNSMFLVGAIDAALKEAEILEDPSHVPWLKAFRARLVQGINALWDPARNAYPDSIRDDGSISPSTCQHTSFLSLLYDVVDPSNAPAALRNLTAPPETMVRPGSPFAVLYLYEAFEKLGLDDEIIKDIYKNYLPMIEAGATTVWESFPSGTTGGRDWPTRSHCHAWSSAPTRFLNRIVLGVRETSAGGRSLRVSPRLSGLTWAKGSVVTQQGLVTVSWKRTGDTLDLAYSAPAGVAVEFKTNETLAGLTLTVNGKKI